MDVNIKTQAEWDALSDKDLEVIYSSIDYWDLYDLWCKFDLPTKVFELGGDPDEPSVSDVTGLMQTHGIAETKSALIEFSSSVMAKWPNINETISEAKKHLLN